MKQDEAAYPSGVRLLGSATEMLEAAGGAHVIEEFRPAVCGPI
jgi:hypothetical protein